MGRGGFLQIFFSISKTWEQTEQEKNIPFKIITMCIGALNFIIPILSYRGKYSYSDVKS